MKKFLTFIGSSTLLLTAACVNATPQTAIGYWKSIDDKTGQALSIVQFYPEKDGTLSGKIYSILPVAGQSPKDICQACTGALQNKPILGMRIIWGMQPQNDGSYIGGRALDPKSGSVYRARMSVADDGCQLHLRGYIGVPLIGRTETWLRTKSTECK